MSDLDLSHSEVPSKSEQIAESEFIARCSISQERLQELLALGWLKACNKTENSLMFTITDVYKVQKLERLCIDFEIEALPAAIIVDLITRVDSLEKELAILRAKGV